MTKGLLNKLAHGIALSIPLLVMLSLALVTWWLVLITPEMPDFTKKKPLREDSDLIVYDFSLQRFDSMGALRTDIAATKAERFLLSDQIIVQDIDLISTEALQSIEKSQPALNAKNVDFFRITAIADKGIIHPNQELIEFLDNAYITRQPYELEGAAEKVEFWGDELKVYLDEGHMLSDKPVDISQDGTRFTANAMTYDYAKNTIELRGRVIGESTQIHP